MAAPVQMMMKLGKTEGLEHAPLRFCRRGKLH